MASSTTTTTTSTKPKRRRFREFTLSSTTTTTTTTLSPGCHSPMTTYSPLHESHPATCPPSRTFSNFNSALSAGLLNPMSPPPPGPTRSSPTLFEMMSNEPDPIPRPPNDAVLGPKSPQLGLGLGFENNKQGMMKQRIAEIMANRSPGSQFGDVGTGDIRVTLSSADGFRVELCVHRQILVGHSRFFAGKLMKRGDGNVVDVEIKDCEDVEVYVETLGLIYARDLRRRLIREDVNKVLAILKVSAAIGFDAGVLSCLEYLEAAPWAEDEEEKVASLLSELRLEGIGATSEVLKRVSLDVTSPPQEHNNDNNNEQVLLKLLHVVLEGKDEKARREMKGLVSKMLRENANQTDLRKESLYSACDACLTQLNHHFLQASSSNLKEVGQIARQSDNLHWILDILIDRHIAEDFLKTWASQLEMSKAHSKVPPVHRFEVSRVTARLFVGIGKGHILCSKEARFALLQTWLVPFYDDFGWMRRASKGLDRHLIEDGLSNTILTLPLSWQQDILLAWFDRFLNSGEDCPNIQRGFEVWWRRAFWRRRNGGGCQSPEPNPRVRVANGTCESPRVRVANGTSENS